jgi:aspartate racemase
MMPLSLTPQSAAGRPSSAVVPGIIGIVGGVGPFAGLDLLGKILAQTAAARDQEHLPIIHLSWPGPIPDRTEYLLGRVAENPAGPLLAQLGLLSDMGATAAGIPCNTAHALAIFDPIRKGVAGFERPLRLLHLIEETVRHLTAHYGHVRTVGVLSTTGAWRARLYPDLLERRGFRAVAPDEALQAEVHAAIYAPTHGIKAVGRVTTRARAALERGIVILRAAGAEAIVLGCTELPLAFPGRDWEGLPLVDPTMALARALIRAVDETRLRPWETTP